MRILIRFLNLREARWLPLLMLLAGATVAHAREQIKVYTVPKENAPVLAPRMAGAGHPPMMPLRPKLTWKTPEGWNEAAPGEVRVASFNVQGAGGAQADVSVIPLSGRAGGDLANVNRWRGQVELPPLTAEELKQAAIAVEIAGEPADFYDFTGSEAGSGDSVRLLAAIQHREGTAWFYKMMGNADLVTQHREAFLGLLASVGFAAPDPTDHSHPPTFTGELPPGHPPVPESGLPAGHPPIGEEALPAGHPEVSTTTTSTAEIRREGQPQWQVPAGWREVAGGQFLVAKFILASGGKLVTDVNVSMSAGDGGGWLGNVNRWQMQLGQKQLSAAELAATTHVVEAGDARISFLELSGTDGRSGQAASIVGAMVPQAGRTWFYKLMGDPAVVTAQKAAFTEFVQTVKY